jgi:hypothetical protein
MGEAEGEGTGDQKQSQTKFPTLYMLGDLDGRIVWVLDTPGFLDTEETAVGSSGKQQTREVTDEERTSLLGTTLDATADLPYLNAVVCVSGTSAGRMTGKRAQAFVQGVSADVGLSPAAVAAARLLHVRHGSHTSYLHAWPLPFHAGDVLTVLALFNQYVPEAIKQSGSVCIVTRATSEQYVLVHGIKEDTGLSFKSPRGESLAFFMDNVMFSASLPKKRVTAQRLFEDSQEECDQLFAALARLPEHSTKPFGTLSHLKATVDGCRDTILDKVRAQQAAVQAARPHVAGAGVMPKARRRATGLLATRASSSPLHLRADTKEGRHEAGA